MPRAYSIPHPKVDQAVIDHLRERIKRRRDLGYTDVNVSIIWAQQFLIFAEKELKHAHR